MTHRRRRPPRRPSDGLLRGIYDELTRQGWILETRPGGHVCAKSPHGPQVFMAASPSDKLAVRNMLGTLRRNGFVWPVR